VEIRRGTADIPPLFSPAARSGSVHRGLWHVVQRWTLTGIVRWPPEHGWQPLPWVVGAVTLLRCLSMGTAVAVFIERECEVQWVTFHRGVKTDGLGEWGHGRCPARIWRESQS
jgi:hypothetical protein